MKKSAWFLLWFCVFCMAFSLPYSAESFVDDCSSDLSTLTRETYNLVDADGYFQSFPSKPVEDTTALSIQDYKEYGEIIYSIEDVQEVTVSAVSSVCCDSVCSCVCWVVFDSLSACWVSCPQPAIPKASRQASSRAHHLSL